MRELFILVACNSIAYFDACTLLFTTRDNSAFVVVSRSAYPHVVAQSTVPRPHAGRNDLQNYLTKGYTCQENEKKSASETLEYALGALWLLCDENSEFLFGPLALVFFCATDLFALETSRRLGSVGFGARAGQERRC